MTSKNWIKTTIEECSTILGDGLHGTPIYQTNGEYAFVNGNNLINGKIKIKEDTKKVSKIEFQKYKKPLNNRTLLVSINGTLGNVAEYNNEKIILGKSACYFNIKLGIDKQFVKYILISKNFQDYLQNQATGTTIKNISLKQMREYDFLLPPLETQQKIAKVLSAIDDKIELNNKINENLEQQAQAIFKSWFVDFEPFGGTMPDAWEEGTINDIAEDIICGKTPSTSKKEYYGEDVPFITIPDMHNNVFVTKTERCLSKLGADSQIKKLLPTNSICVSCIATAGLVSLTAVESQTNQQINSIIPKSDISPYYIYLLLKSLSDRIIMFGSSGSTTCNLNKGQFAKIEIVIPDKDILNKYHRLVEPMFLQINNLQYENEQLSRLRDTLLPKLMSGEIDVEKVKIQYKKD